eukprot:Amastigsp_a853034_7.p2 type:complete len:181 gc:universal Amastigsp_a853034_7:55-597(+)
MLLICSTNYRLRALGESDEGDVGVGNTLADKVLGAVTASAAVVGKSGGSDIGDVVANLLLQEQTAAVAVEREVHEAVLATGVPLVVLKLIGLSRAGEVEGSSVGGLDVEAEAVVVGSFRLASVEFGNLPDVVTLSGDRAGCGVLARLERSSSGKASGGEERGDGGELHFHEVDLRFEVEE